MDTQRLILFFVLSFSILFLWDSWQKEQTAPAAQTVASSGSPAATPAATPAFSAPATVPAAQQVLQRGERLKVVTDVLTAEIDAVGGDLRHVEFVRHGDPEDAKRRFTLYEDKGERLYVAQTGFVGTQLPNHQTVYRFTQKSVELPAGSASTEVRLQADMGQGITVEKVYTFHRGSYRIDLKHEVTNNGAAPVSGNLYAQFLRDNKPPRGDSSMVPTYTGAAVFTEQAKFRKVAFEDIDKAKREYPTEGKDGWIAMVQHYFVSAWLPEKGVQREYFTRKLGENLYAVGTVLCGASQAKGCETIAVKPGQKQTFGISLYAGPQEQRAIEKIAPGLEYTVDYGWLAVFAFPMFWALAAINDWVGNWGVAIILLTLLVKLLFYPLSAKSYQSMARMKVVAPKLQKIKELYGDDRQRLHQAMMELYKTEKINPLGGCLPILVQIPVFIALYWVLLSAVEIRQAPFMLWIQDLSVQDPYYVLPLIMGITMLVQTKLNPPSPDPMQQKVMMAMPVIFTVFFLFFPAGLVLYWVVNNVLSIAQQWYVNRSTEAARLAHGKH